MSLISLVGNLAYVLYFILVSVIVWTEVAQGYYGLRIRRLHGDESRYADYLRADHHYQRARHRMLLLLVPTVVLGGVAGFLLQHWFMAVASVVTLLIVFGVPYLSKTLRRRLESTEWRRDG